MRRATRLGCVLGLVPTIVLGAEAVLTVDGREITAARLESTRRAVAAQAGGRQIDAAALQRIAVDQVIGQALLVGAARAAGIVVTSQEIDAAVEAQRRAAGGGEALAARLRQVGLSEDDIREVEADRIAVQRFVETVVASSVEVSDAEVKSYYDSHPDEFEHDAQIKVRQIMAVAPLAAPEAQRARARARLEQALERLRAGERFETVAAELSDDPSKSKGGEIGWVHKGMLLPDLEEAVFSLEDGQLSAVLESRSGFHVFRVDARRGPGSYSLDEATPILRQMLLQRKVARAVAEFVAERRRSASVVVLDPSLEAFVKSPDGESQATP